MGLQNLCASRHQICPVSCERCLWETTTKLTTERNQVKAMVFLAAAVRADDFIFIGNFGGMGVLETLSMIWKENEVNSKRETTHLGR